MPISAADLPRLSRLLDEALEVDAGQLEAWYAALPAPTQHLVPALRIMVTEARRAETSGLLSSLPNLSEGGDDLVTREGEVVGPYRLLRPLGQGGMGTVWLAERADGAFKRRVALKLPRLTWAAGLVRRMARERDIGAMLEHPNIARLYDAGIDDKERPYLALEYIEGVPIDAWCKGKHADVRETLQLILQVARAVAYAHQRMVVHRDLKPSNVLVSADGQAHLLDFGVARLLDQDGELATLEHTRAMTPQYASPEQLKGLALTVQTDVYSLGVMAYQLLTGSAPYAPKRKSISAMEEAVLLGDVPLPSSRAMNATIRQQLKGDIDAIVGKAMKTDPAQRYATAEAMAIDIERHLGGQAVSARPDGIGYRLKKTLRRHWIGISASAALVASIVAGFSSAYHATRTSTESAQLLELVGKGDAGPLSIVVLPFANLTGDPNQAYVADGLTSAVTADLSRLSDAFIVDASTAFKLKDKRLTVQQVGKALGVRFALQGSVQRDGDRIRINAQLSETESQAQLWTESFEGSQTDLFALQDLVTTRIANSIGPKMVVTAAGNAQAGKSDPQAADLMLRAKAIALRPRSQANFAEQQAIYRRVLVMEPENAKAMMALAQSLALQATDHESNDPATDSPRQAEEARDLALRARKLDPHNDGIEEVLASYAAVQGDGQAAIRIAAEALSRNPKDPKRLWHLSKAYLWAGQCEKSIELMNQVIKLDPRDPAADVLFNMSYCLFMIGEDRSAVDWMLKAKDKNPYWLETHVLLAMAYARLGDMDRSREARDTLLRADPTYDPSRWNGMTFDQMKAVDREFWERIRPAWRLAKLPE